MRVYELSKQLGRTNKEIIELLTKQGFDVASHMTVLSPESIQFLQNHFKQKQEHKAQGNAVVHEPKKNNIKEKSTAKQSTSGAKKSNAPFKHKRQTPASTAHQVQPRKVEKVVESKQIGVVIKPMAVGDFAESAGLPVSEVILHLLKQGSVCAKNQLLPEKVVEQLAQHFEIPILTPVKKTEEVLIAKDNSGTQERLPVVVVVGHVDHGKTTLLDFIRNTKVAAKEKGGITQHLGAYEVKTHHGNIVFLDTPGHAAFSKIRGRGVKVADIAILVVAADDGVMPQTIEAIKHAEALNVPMVVAINKIDKVAPDRLDVVKRGLAQYGLAPEDWGGQTVCVPISGKTGKGVDELLDIVALQAQLLELKTNLNVPAQGFVLESKLERGRGPVATVICQQGVLKVGDYFVAGKTFGRVTSLVNSVGAQIREAIPSQPALVGGFSELPNAGDVFSVVSAKEYKVAKSGGVQHEIMTRKHTAQEAINIIVKSDNASSKEALVEAIEKIQPNGGKAIRIIYAGVGDINESNVMLAHDTQSMIYGFHVKVEAKAVPLVQKERITVKLFDIIYKALEELEETVKASIPQKTVSTKVGEARVKKVFDIKGVGVIAGAYVTDGVLNRTGRMVVMRDKHKVGEGPIKSLEREKRSVKEVQSGFDCAFMVDGFNDWQIDDKVECFVETIVKP